MSMELPRVETVYQGYLTVMAATVAGLDGETLRREIEHHGRAACVLPYDAERRIALLINQPRAPVGDLGGRAA